MSQAALWPRHLAVKVLLQPAQAGVAGDIGQRNQVGLPFSAKPDGELAIEGNYLYTDHGQGFNQTLGTQVGTFNEQADAFVLDPAVQKLFGITANGSTHTLYAFSTNTLALIGTDVLTGFSGNVSSPPSEPMAWL